MNPLNLQLKRPLPRQTSRASLNMLQQATQAAAAATQAFVFSNFILNLLLGSALQ
jgi:hypothetical protein